MLGFGDGRRGKEPRNASSSKSWTRKGNRFLRGFQKEHGPTDTWILVSYESFQTSDPQKCKMINLCCFKPTSLW